MNLLRMTIGALAGAVAGAGMGLFLGFGMYWWLFLFGGILGVGRWSELVRTILAGASVLVPTVILGVTGAVIGARWMRKE